MEDDDETRPLLATSNRVNTVRPRALQRFPILNLLVVYILFTFNDHILGYVSLFHARKSLSEGPALILNILVTGAWCHFARVWGRKPVMMMSILGSALASVTAALIVCFAGNSILLRIIPGIVYALFGGRTVFTALVITYITEMTLIAYIFPLFCVLRGLEPLVRMASVQLAFVLARIQPFSLGYIVGIAITLPVLLAILVLLPNTQIPEPAPTMTMAVLRQPLSSLFARGQTKMITGALGMYSLTLAFDNVRVGFGILSGRRFVSWYMIGSFCTTAVALLLFFPLGVHLYNRKHSETLLSSYRLVQTTILGSLIVQISCTLIIIAIGTSSAIAHLVFDIPIAVLAKTVLPGLLALAALVSPSTEIFAGLTLVELVGGFISSNLISTLGSFWESVVVCRVLYGIWAVLLVGTACFVALAPAERSHSSAAVPTIGEDSEA